MTHPPDSMLLGLATGAPMSDEDARAHVGRCAACQLRVDAFRRVHAALGEWSVEPGGQDVTATVLERIDAEARRPSAPLLAWRQIRRFAAAILIGVGVGYVGSSTMHAHTGTAAPAEPADANAEVDDSLDLLARPASTGLWLTFGELNPDESDAEGGA